MSETKATLADCAEGRAFKEQVRQRVEMETEYEALGLRALACKHWRWMSGMLGLSIQSSSRSIWIRVVDPPNDDTAECWPDFRDPATLGCLLALVREASNDPEAHAEVLSSYRGVWICYFARDTRAKEGKSEAEVLVAALEAASQPLDLKDK